MSTVEVHKFHGAGNDFLIRSVSSTAELLSDAAVQGLCARRSGVGADGVIEVVVEEREESAPTYVMVLRNSDGSRAAMSGNGLRCLGHYLFLRSGGERSFTVMTDAGSRSIEVLLHSDDGVEMDGETSMSSGMLLGFQSALGYQGVLVDMGNPHLVVVGPAVEEDPGWLQRRDLLSEGPKLEAGFDGGMNVEFVQFDGDGSYGRPKATMVVWERGVGPTLACGTGSCAIFLAGRELGIVGDLLRVENPGGSLGVRVDEGELFLSGPTRAVGLLRLNRSEIDSLERGPWL